jgi:hypothetical protein
MATKSGSKTRKSGKKASKKTSAAKRKGPGSVGSKSRKQAGAKTKRKKTSIAFRKTLGTPITSGGAGPGRGNGGERGW